MCSQMLYHQGLVVFLPALYFYLNGQPFCYFLLLGDGKSLFRRKVMNYDKKDFLETADHDTLEQIARTRELTRKYYFSDYNDRQNRDSIL